MEQVGKYVSKPFKTAKQMTDFEKELTECSDLFWKKNKDYGTSWRSLRMPSITGQMLIKSESIRNIQNVPQYDYDGAVLVLKDNFTALVNYSVIALMQLELGPAKGYDYALPEKVLIGLHSEIIAEAKELHIQKDNDYNGVWRCLSVGTIADIILMKLLRIKQIEENKGTVIVSEGVKGGYQDILNYAVFALIKLKINDLDGF